MAAGNVISAFPLSPQDAQSWLPRLHELDSQQLWWLSGYAAGLAQRSGVAQAVGQAVQTNEPVADAAPALRATVLYGTATNNAKRIAEQLGADLSARGVEARVQRLSQYKTKDLAQEALLYFVVSTQGEGEPPEDSVPFFKFLSGNRAPKLDKTQFAVLALGDKSYAEFCAFGKSIEKRLLELGAKPLFARADADVEFEPVAKAFRETALEKLPAGNKPAANVLPLKTSAAHSHYHRDKPFAAPILAVQKITARDSDKDIRHVELSLEGSGLHYQPGDSLGIWPRNPQSSVDAVLQTSGINGDENVTRDGETLSVREWLRKRLEITQLAKPVLEAYAKLAGNAELNALLASDSKTFQAWLKSHQLFDVLRAFPASLNAEQLIALLRKLTPRMYSIASAQDAVGEEVHLTIAVVDDRQQPTPRRGAASFYLSELTDADSVEVFIEHNDQFRLPADDRDIILIGPGTGVAPFRAFIQQREESAAEGRSWLFFGNPKFTSDFLYQIEWQAALKSGVLSKLSLAFSRDQAEKIYVQHRLREHGAELWQWLHNGAYLYVCGDASRMAPDVHQALIDIAVQHGGFNAEQADEYLTELKSEGRYQRDVY